MSLERSILLAILAFSLAVLYFGIPRSQIREALISFTSFQVLTWPVGLALTGLGWITYPIRMFPQASNLGFMFDYLLCPAVFALFQVRYPQERSLMKQGLHYAAYTAGIALLQWWVADRTGLIDYISWTVYLSVLLYLAEYWITRRYVIWFLRRWAPTLRGGR
ncbi:CBO0543 family protein [Paenibacillus sp. S-38]|uniref:CBO0543 family protein n=1 Tax=Paenibacillus sp. S-38 TaxID=3416710 RepID=UPI003CE6908C